MKKLFFLLFCFSFPAHAIELALPIECQINIDCFIQNYPDTDAEKNAKDYRCGHMTYDGHKGTDIRLPDYVVMEKGVNVLAAADGTIKAFREGMEDININKIDSKTIKDRECGNGVVIQHADKWETQYCHMKKGSIIVKNGQTIRAGEKLGAVGLSGETEFPHLHFEVRHEGKVIDPFTAKEKGKEVCDISKETTTLWQDGLKQKLNYRPTHIMNIGFATEKPEPENARQGKYNLTSFPANAEIIIMWADMIGTKEGQELSMQVTAPDGSEFITHKKVLDSPKAQLFFYIGKKTKGEAWAVGKYKAKVTLHGNKSVSEEVILDEKEAEFEITP